MPVRLSPQSAADPNRLLRGDLDVVKKFAPVGRTARGKPLAETSSGEDHRRGEGKTVRLSLLNCVQGLGGFWQPDNMLCGACKPPLNADLAYLIGSEGLERAKRLSPASWLINSVPSRLEITSPHSMPRGRPASVKAFHPVRGVQTSIGLPRPGPRKRAPSFAISTHLGGLIAAVSDMIIASWRSEPHQVSRTIHIQLASGLVAFHNRLDRCASHWIGQPMRAPQRNQPQRRGSA